MALQAIWRLEIVILSGYAAFYGWLVSKFNAGVPPVGIEYILSISTIFCGLCLYRLKVDYSILKALGEYSGLLEAYIYGGDAQSKPVGWQKYLNDTSRPGREFPSVCRRYIGATITFAFLLFVNCGLTGWVIYLRFGDGGIQGFWA
ncbi:hypothetical protein [Phaeobacter piscinae]|nr:hypothetical protein [Phaeobacter piscinae]